MEAKRITLDEVAKYSKLPKSLLSLEPAVIRQKTEKEVMREFNAEKWSQLLDYAKSEKNLTLEKMENKYGDLSEWIVGYDEKGFLWITYGDLLKKQFELYAQALAPYTKGATALVELGAGFGSKIFDLAKRKEFSHMPLVGAEISENGREAMKILSTTLKTPITLGSCDFRKLQVDKDLIPPNSLIFTSLSAHYVPQMSSEFTDFLIAMKPKAVVHFEPFFEHFSTDSLHDLMCRRYIDINDYTRNLGTVIDRGVENKRIKVLEERKKVLGLNPFLPISVLAWAPLE